MIKDFHKAMKSVERIENRVVGQVPESDAARSTQDGVVKFSISSKGLNTNQASVANVTVAFFTNNFPAGFALDKGSDSWNDMDLNERKKIRNHCGTIKRAVRMALMHADSFPPPSPEGSEPWKESLGRMATAAEEHTCEDLDFGKKVITIHEPTKHQDLKTLEANLKLPDDTPEHPRKLFKSDWHLIHSSTPLSYALPRRTTSNSQKHLPNPHLQKPGPKKMQITEFVKHQNSIKNPCLARCGNLPQSAKSAHALWQFATTHVCLTRHSCGHMGCGNLPQSVF